MDTKKIYPLSFSHSLKEYQSLLSTLLIHANYDSNIKHESKYKGMHCESGEYWTVKFSSMQGIYGLVISNVENKVGYFSVYYFPSKEELLIEQSSLMEGILAADDKFIDKVRKFALYPELLENFYIGQIAFFMDKDQFSLYVCTKTRERSIARDGIKNPNTQHDFIIKPNEKDKDFPSLRVMLVVVNFFNKTLVKLLDSSCKKLEFYDAKNAILIYDKSLHSTLVDDQSSKNIFLGIHYQNRVTCSVKDVFNKNNNMQEIHDKSCMRTYINSLVNKKKFFISKEEAVQNIKPNFIVVSGFLGSGKTTFLQNFIEYETQKNHFVGIIQNEIGKVGLDGKMLDYDYSMVEVDEGCVCCSMSGQIRAGVKQLTEKAVPDTILLETTGVANPFNLLSEIDEIKDIVNFKAIIVVIDSFSFFDALKQYQITMEQLKSADIILLNKIDLIDEECKKRILETITKYNKCATVLEVVNCDINPNTLPTDELSNTSHIASMIIEDETSITHKNDKINTIKQELSGPIDKTAFENYLSIVSKKVFRIKGIVDFGLEEQYVVQFVNGKYSTTSLNSKTKQENFLIYIGEDIDNSFLWH